MQPSNPIHRRDRRRHLPPAQREVKRSLSMAWMCITGRPLLASAGTNQESGKGDSISHRVESCAKSVQLSTSTETGSYFRLIDSCITQFKASGPSRTCTRVKNKKKTPPDLDARSNRLFQILDLYQCSLVKGDL